MYYKVIRDNEIIDAVRSTVYVRRNPRNGVILTCREELAQGIVSWDSSTIYQLADKPSLEGEYDVVWLVKIDETEFQLLRDLIDGVETEDPETPNDTTETPEDPGDTTEPELPMSVPEMRTKIIALEEQLAATKILLGVE